MINKNTYQTYHVFIICQLKSAKKSAESIKTNGKPKGSISITNDYEKEYAEDIAYYRQPSFRIGSIADVLERFKKGMILPIAAD